MLVPNDILAFFTWALVLQHVHGYSYGVPANSNTCQVDGPASGHGDKSPDFPFDVTIDGRLVQPGVIFEIEHSREVVVTVENKASNPAAAFSGFWARFGGVEPNISFLPLDNELQIIGCGQNVRIPTTHWQTKENIHTCSTFSSCSMLSHFISDGGGFSHVTNDTWLQTTEKVISCGVRRKCLG